MTITESLGEKWGGGLSYERRHLRICICIYGLSSRAGTVLARHLKFKSQRRWKRISIFPLYLECPADWEIAKSHFTQLGSKVRQMYLHI